MSRSDRISAGVLWAATMAVFGAGAPNLGFYYDDATWLATLANVDLAGLWPMIRDYTPGRHLHVLWLYALLQLAPTLAAQHLAQSALDGVIAAGFFLLLRRVGVPVHAACVAAALFSFWPAHGETHFWITCFASHLVPVFLVIAFAWPKRAGAGPWLFDLAVFLGALFTYDQVFVVLLGIVAWRGRGVALHHLPHLAAAGVFLWQKLAAVPGRAAPTLRAEASRLLIPNVFDTISHTAGGRFIRHFERATATDWLLALAAAAGLTALAFWLWRREAVSTARRAATKRGPPRGGWGLGDGGRGGGPARRRIFKLAAAFWLGAYLPAWLWFLAPRSHYLPSVGLFAAGAVAFWWILERCRPRAIQFALWLAMGGVTCAFAAASRGESRRWEDAFRAKQRLFAELRPQLEGFDILVLEGFPTNLGPAYLLTPPDTTYGPRLLDPAWRTPVSIGVSPAPAGLFLFTHSAYGPHAYQYYATRRALVARFTGWDGGRLRYEKRGPPPAPYQVTASSRALVDGPFQVTGAAARRDGEALVVSLEIHAPLPPGSRLAAVISYIDHDEFHPWGHDIDDHSAGVLPILLSEAPGGFSGELRLRLDSFPETDRIRLEFYQVGSESAPRRLGTASTEVSR